MHLETDPVPERVVEALLEHLTGLLGELGRYPGLLVGLAGDAMNLTSGHAGAHRLPRAGERLERQLVVAPQLPGNLADHERSRHVGVTGRRRVARPEVDDDGLTRSNRPDPIS